MTVYIVRSGPSNPPMIFIRVNYTITQTRTDLLQYTQLSINRNYQIWTPDRTK